MAVTGYSYRWSLDEFLLAWEAGAFDDRAELIDGEVWAVPIGPWHGRSSGRVVRALPNERFEVVLSSLSAGESLPDPDCWVLRAGAQPVTQLSRRMVRWAPADVLLVVEVSDETVDHDLGRKAVLYARSSYPRYWVVAREGVYDHSEPSDVGYASRRLYQPGDRIPVPYVDGETLAVSDLIAPD